ncbi:MAG: glycosyltransferase family 8 protein [Bacteroidales bacterium]|nr:glycosyltransferase family 8 protein [Bacteroidales bacterium]
MALDLFTVRSIKICHLLEMNKVPIVFAFDNNLMLPAGVCIYSLLANARPDTFYDIYILYPENDKFDVKYFDKLSSVFSNYTLSFLSVSEFISAFEIRGITKPTYYRLLIPELFPQYDKVLYADVDIIFRQDLSSIYNADCSGYYIAATYDLCMNLDEGWKKYVEDTIKLRGGEYIQAGFLVINCKELRRDGVVDIFKEKAKNKYKFQDQDILNICCSGKVQILPWHCNMTDYAFYYLNVKPELLTDKYANSDIELAKTEGNLHFNGHKPWIKYSVNFDVWWEFYRKSPFYNEKYYFDFFYGRLNEYDRLSLWKRIKILLRFFVFGRYPVENRTEHVSSI